MEDLNIKFKQVARYEAKDKTNVTYEARDNYVIAFVLSGQITCNLNNIKYVVKNHQAIVLDKNDVCELLFKNATVQIFEFNTDFEFINSDEKVVYLENYEYINRLIKDFNYNWNFKPKYFELKCKSTLYNLVFTFLRALENPLTNYHVTIMKHYIQQHYLEKIKIQDLADVTGLNAIYCGALFNKYVGTTIAQYIHQLRVLHAEMLLGNTDINISEVAFKSGFDDIYYFSKIFKQIKGVSPSQYRKNLIE